MSLKGPKAVIVPRSRTALGATRTIESGNTREKLVGERPLLARAAFLDLRFGQAFFTLEQPLDLVELNWQCLNQRPARLFEQIGDEFFDLHNCACLIEPMKPNAGQPPWFLVAEIIARESLRTPQQTRTNLGHALNLGLVSVQRNSEASIASH